MSNFSWYTLNQNIHVELHYIFTYLQKSLKKKFKCRYHFNKRDVNPSVLDDSVNVIMTIRTINKKIECNKNNDISFFSIPVMHMFFLNRSVPCKAEANNNFLLETLLVCTRTLDSVKRKQKIFKLDN